MKSTYWLVVVVLLLSAASFGQAAPFYSISINSQTAVVKPASAFGTAQMINGSVGAANLPAGDSLIGSAVQFLPSSGAGTADCANSSNNFVPFVYGGSGYVMFPDGQGGGIGWKFASATGAWSMQRTNGNSGKWIMTINLTSPYWIAPPTQSTSPSLIQMSNAGSAVVTLTLDFIPNSIGNVSAVNQGMFCQLKSGTTVTSLTLITNGRMDLYY